MINNSDNQLQRANRKGNHERTRQTGSLKVVLQVNGKKYKTGAYTCIQERGEQRTNQVVLRVSTNERVTSIQMVSKKIKLEAITSAFVKHQFLDFRSAFSAVVRNWACP